MAHRLAAIDPCPSRLVVAALILIVLFDVGCALRKGLAGSPREDGSGAIALFRARADLPGDPGRRFRLLVFAEMPDRLHAEVLGPVGGPRLVVDAGAGRLAVAVVPERIAYRGTLEAGQPLEFLGLGISVEDLVRVMLTGASDAGIPSFRREPRSEVGLPREFDIATPHGWLRLTRLRFVNGDSGDSVGTGAAPEGFEIRPLEELAARDEAFFAAVREVGP